VKTATHRHRLADYRNLQYLVTEKGVFMMIDGEWKKSSVVLKDLKPLDTPLDKDHNCGERILVGTHCKSGEILEFNSLADAADQDFTYNGIYKCLHEDQKTHNGYTWRWAA
jgi:hypothetical protein